MNTMQVQLLLSYLGYFVAPDGVAGPLTKDAIREFQGDFGGLTVDGLAGEKTQKALRHAVAYNMFRPEKAAQEAVTEPQDVPAWWGDIKYFRREEPYIGCSCGACGGFPAEPQEKLMRLADQVREHFGSPLRPTSTVRCAAHNANVGGVANSRHLQGKAMDFKVDGRSAGEVLAWVQEQKAARYAYAVSDRVVHMDIE